MYLVVLAAIFSTNEILIELSHNSVVIKALTRMSETTIRLAILLLLGVQDGQRVSWTWLRADCKNINLYED